ncbi:MAG: hypothetical protein QF579_04780, partial [Dehalococcoidia bacterium]|nr:hypothetical protein [Dehalococcoidia bacterium]
RVPYKPSAPGRPDWEFTPAQFKERGLACQRQLPIATSAPAARSLRLHPDTALYSSVTTLQKQEKESWSRNSI